MTSLRAQLRQEQWGLTLSRALAHQIIGRRSSVQALITELFGDDPNVRKRAADVAHRITDVESNTLEPYADELCGLLETLPLAESRTRWHLGLVVPRIAGTHTQRMRAARAISLLANDDNQSVCCSAVEGMTALALREPSLRDAAEEMVVSFLRTGTAAMKCRARYAEKQLQSIRRDDQQ